ncbi:hypothetical protein AX16_010802 [Volvariella volvacea WC 439]|nr:hypothetical protein AX16_010802 [Volvariella volvacea WC 439]
MAYQMYIFGLIQQGLIPPQHDVEEGYFFFYGTCTLPHIFKKTLGLEEAPTYRDARIRGYDIKMCGQQPVLVESESDPLVKVEGKAWFGNENNLERLQKYAGNNYKWTNASMRLEGEKRPVVGWAFEWAGDPSELQDGVFDPSQFAEGS